MKNILTVVGILLVSALGLLGQEDTTIAFTIYAKGDNIVVENEPVSIAVIDAETIKKEVINRPEELIQNVAGVEVGDYNQGGVANTFMIRGFSNGGHGGDAAVFIDGIPLNEGLSHADGYADMNVIIPLELSSVEVYKGPSTALYGNFAKGGSVAFTTKKGGNENILKMSYGSFNTFDIQGAFAHELSEKVTNNSAIQFSMTDGYQENSQWLRGNASTRFGFQLTPKIDFALSLRAHGSYWDAPGYIPKAQFDNPDSTFMQAVNAENDGGEKRYYNERLDFGYSFTENTKLLFWVYGTQQDFTRYAKFGYAAGGQTEKDYDRSVGGTGVSINFGGKIGSFDFTGVSGVELYSEKTDRAIYDTDFRVRQGQSQDRTYIIRTLSQFNELYIEFHRLFRPLVGLRYDLFGGEAQDHMASTTYGINEYSSFSPKAGFSSKIIEPLVYRFSYSKGFSLPDDDAKYDSAFAVDPTELHQFETGLLFEIPTIASFDVAAYMIDTKNEVYEVAPGSGVYKNLGTTRRQGIELEASVLPISQIELTGAFSAIGSEVRDNPTDSLNGKEVPGVPKTSWNVGVSYTARFGLGADLSFRSVGEYWLDEENSESYEGYHLLSGNLSYTHRSRKGSSYRFFAGVKNITGEHYSQSIWSGFGTTNYSVSAPRSYTAGVQLAW